MEPKKTAHELPEHPNAETVYRLSANSADGSIDPERVDRNRPWITKEEQSMLLGNAVVGIAGCGGMGGLASSVLLRTGIGEIRIADNERFDASNINRQFGARKDTVGMHKAFETARLLRAIADDSTVEVYPMGITEESVRGFVHGCTVVLDEIEFWALGSRMLLHRAAREEGVPVLNAPTVGHRVYAYLYTPDSMTLEEVVGMGYEEACALQKKVQERAATKDEVQKLMQAMLRFAVPEMPEYSLDLSHYSSSDDLRKRLFEEGTAGIVGTNPPMAAGYLANLALFMILKQSVIGRSFVTPPPMPGYLMFDAGLLAVEKCETIWW